MRVLIGSINPSKIRAVEEAFKKLKIQDVEVIGVKVDSNVPSKPIGFEILRGCENRNNFLKKYANSEKIDYDYLCSIEGGFSLDENGLPFIVTYALIEDKNGKKSTGKSLGLRLNREIYRYVRENGSLNKIIEEINGSTNNKQNEGITGFLSNGILSRDNVDHEAVVSSLIPLVFKENYDLISNNIGMEE